jgi:archaellin
MQAIKFVTVAAVMSEVMNKKSFKAQKKAKKVQDIT